MYTLVGGWVGGWTRLSLLPTVSSNDQKVLLLHVQHVLKDLRLARNTHRMRYGVTQRTTHRETRDVHMPKPHTRWSVHPIVVLHSKHAAALLMGR